MDIGLNMNCSDLFFIVEDIQIVLFIILPNKYLSEESIQTTHQLSFHSILKGPFSLSTVISTVNLKGALFVHPKLSFTFSNFYI